MYNGIANNPSLKVFWKNLKKILEPLKLGDATRRGIKEELKKIPIPGFSFLLEFVNSCYEAAREAARKVPQDAAVFYAQLSRNLEKTKFSQIVAGLKEIGIESEPNRLLLAAMLKSMGKLEAFQSPKPITLNAILKGVITHRQESLWRHNQTLTILYHIGKSLEGSHCENLAAIENMDHSIQDSHLKIIDQIMEIRNQLNELPKLAADVYKSYKLQETQELEAEYLNQVKAEYGYLQLIGIPYGEEDPLPINPAFVSLFFKEKGEESQPHSVENILADKEALLIVGKAGSGKSTLLQWEAVQCSSSLIDKNKGRFNRWHGMIPFFLRIRKFNQEENFPLTDSWVELSTPNWIKKNNDNVKSWLQQVLDSGRALLILDGLDEMNEKRRTDFWLEMGKIARQYQIVYRVSSRLNPDVEVSEEDEDRDKEDKNRPEKRRSWEFLPGIKRVEVCDLSLDKIDDLIDQWHESFIEMQSDKAKREMFRNTVGHYPAALKAKLRGRDYQQIRDLIKTPLLCAALCVTNKYKGQDLDKNKSVFYKDVCGALLQARDVRRKVKVNLLYDKLNFEDAFYIHAFIAYEMMINRPDEKEESEYLIEAPFYKVKKWLQNCTGNISDPEIRNHLLSSQPPEFPEYDEFIKYLLERRCLLREPAKRRIDFHHRALQEYLTASIMPEREDLQVLINKADDDRWHDTIRLSGGGYYSKGKTCKEIIEGLLNRGDRISYLLAAANIRNLSPFDFNILDRLLKALKDHVLPPRNEIEAHDIAAVGDDMIPHLTCDTLREEDIKWNALTLLFVGSDRALNALDDWYGKDLNLLLSLLQLAPEVNSLTLPGVLRYVKEMGAIPFPAKSYVYDLKPLERIPEIESLDLSFCRNLIDPVFPDDLRNLKKLNLQNCAGIRKLDGLLCLTELRVLNLRGCVNLTSLEPLESLPYLERIDLSYCPDHLDISPLKEKLQTLEWIGKPDVEILEPSKPTMNPNYGDFYFEKLDGVYIKMAWIPEGKFQMGGRMYEQEKPIHTVNLPGFWMATYQVTQSLYRTIMGTNPSNFKGDYNPVECVSWNEAMEFCKKLSEMTGRKFTLPTEAQWEYSCRAGSGSEYCFGDSETELGDYAWYGENSESKSHPVGTKKPNNSGLYDMHGNVWEWCLDYWHPNYNEAPDDGRTWISGGADRVFRGGGWGSGAGYCRSACRFYFSPVIRVDDLGFRVCLQAGR